MLAGSEESSFIGWIVWAAQNRSTDSFYWGVLVQELLKIVCVGIQLCVQPIG